MDNRLVTGIGRRLAMRFERRDICRLSVLWSFGGASRLSEHPRRAQAPRDRGVRGCDRRGLCGNAASAGEVDSSATLRVEPSTSLVGGSVQADDVKYLDRVVNTYSQLASSPEMGNRVAAELHLAAPPDIEFAQVPNTNLVKLKVTTGDRDSAAPAARRVTSLLISQVDTLAAADVSAAERSFLDRTKRLELEKAQAQAELASLGAGTSASDTERALLLREEINGVSQRLEALRADHERYQSTREANERAVTLVAEPSPPQSPENRNLKLALALAILLGGVVGAGLAFLAENLSRRFRSHDEIEASVDAPVLSAVPAVDGMSERVVQWGFP